MDRWTNADQSPGRVCERWFVLGAVAGKGQDGPQHVWVFMSALSGLKIWLSDNRASLLLAPCPSDGRSQRSSLNSGHKPPDKGQEQPGAWRPGFHASHLLTWLILPVLWRDKSSYYVTLFYLVLTMTSEGGYYPHFTDKKTKA